MNDVERQLRERFAGIEARFTGPDFAPPRAPDHLIRRTRRRQVGVALVGLVTTAAVVAVSIAGATLIRSSERRVPVEPPHPISRGALEAVAAQPVSYTGFVADTDGMLWSSWPGLTRFDPATGSFRTFTAVDDPVFAGIGPVAPAREGGVWLVCGEGEQTIRRFDGQVFHETSAPAPASIGAIAEAPDGLIWASGEGVFSWDGSSWHETPSAGLPSRDVGHITVDTTGSVWVEAYKAGISRFDGSTWTTYPVEEVLPSDQLQVPAGEPDRGAVWTIVPGPDGDVWVGGHGGVAHFADGAWTPYPSASLGLLDVMSIAVADGVVWIGGVDTRAPGIARFDGATWSRVEQGVSGLADAYHSTTVVSAADQIWAAVDGALLRWSGETFLQVAGARPEEIAGWAVAAVSGDELWTAGLGGGAWRLLDDRWTYFAEGTDLPGELHTLSLAPDGTLWATTGGGIARFDGTRWEEVTDGNYQAIAFGPDGRAWAASGRSQNSWVREVGGDALPGAVPLFGGASSLAVLSDHDVWAGAQGGFMPGGLAHSDGRGWTVVERVGGEPVSAVSGIEATPDGDLWVSFIVDRYDSLVARFDGSSWETFHEADGVPFTDGMLELAPDGAIVVTTRAGLVGFRDGAWTPWGSPPAGGFDDLRIVPLSIAPDGTVWLAGAGGLFRLPAS